METVNFLKDAWVTDPMPIILGGVFLMWLWHTDPDAVLWVALVGAVWWWLA